MIITPVAPLPPLPGPATTMVAAFDPTPFPPPRMRSVAPRITQPIGPNHFQIDYLLPVSTRVGDVVEVYLISLTVPFPVLILTRTLDDYSIFLALRRKRGIYTISELSVDVLTSNGITPDDYDCEVVQYGGAIPTPPSPLPQITFQPTTNTAVSFLSTYKFV
ncbi:MULTISPECIES: hypothetical protein [Pseudomonas]|uniref:Uncharacterized protein n=1 Tax=Pseudomonas koreensis TaxID=198620 RepID=A0A9X2XDX0_9PSED|nr:MULTISPECIES: hypothetical protein [Pseudomonas]MBV4473098.1 hypothetical protein [Pseudomonas botevensis]MCU7246734.1 hypothetical protein [Pseudomonas koreensis]